MSYTLLLVEVDGTKTEHETNEALELRVIKDRLGNVDIGVQRPYQYAVGEYSLLNGESPNLVASAMLQREIAGDCFIWGVGEAGESISWNSEEL